MTEERNLKVLVIADGSYPSGIDNVNYTGVSKGFMPNIAEYDVVIFDLTKMNDEKVKALMTSPQFSKKFIHDLLWAKHDLILILDNQKFGNFDVMHYLPISVDLTQVEGTRTEIVDKSFEEYFETQVGNQWSYCLEMKPSLRKILPEYDNKSGYTLYCETEDIALNYYGKPISFKIFYGIRQSGAIERTSGNIFFLQPPYKSESIEEAIKILLSKYGFQFETEVPPWVSDFTAPGEMKIEKEIDQKREEIRAIRGEIDKKEKEKDKIVHYKKILFEYNNELRDVVWDTLEEIGFRVNRYDQKKEDGSIKWNSEVILLEIKGLTKSASTKNVRGLNDWINRYLQEYVQKLKKEPKGLLIINHYRFIHPKERDKPFPDDIRRYIEATNSEICAMTTLQLFDIFCRIKNGELKEDEIKEKIMRTDGIFEWRVNWRVILKNLES